MTKKRMIFVPQTSYGRGLLYSLLGLSAIGPLLSLGDAVFKTGKIDGIVALGTSIDMALAVVTNYFLVCFARFVLVQTKVLKLERKSLPSKADAA